MNIIGGCTNTNKSKLKLIGEKEYLNGFLSHAKITYVNGKAFLCHYDLITHKKIIAESLQDNEKHTIDLSEIISSNSYRIKTFEIINWNEIYLLPHHANQLLVVNGNGQKIKEIDLAPYLNTKGQFMLTNWTGTFIFNDTSMLFPLEFRPESLPLELRDDLPAYDKARYISPRLFKISNFKKDSLAVHFGVENLYRRFSEENILTYDKSNYRFINQQIIYSSMYTDSIYTINPSSLEITGSYKIESDYTDLIVKHITRQALTRAGKNLLMYNMYSNGSIADITFDQLSRNYFVTVFHKPQESNTPVKQLEWSFVVLDSMFTKIDEIKMDANQYNPTCISTANGLYIASNSKHKNDTNYYKKNNYAIFKYD